ncbi:MAG: SurA N-terminal domain-containing protein [Deltaproteobacteria bacterium]|nr:SurA N-terminal domain-containing protein [Deltaproteobacteria bacterium]
MLDIFRRHSKSVMKTVLVFFAAVLMMSFGVEYFSQGNKAPAAAKVNEQEIPYAKYSLTYERAQSSARAQLGANFANYEKFFNFGEQAINALVDEELLKSFYKNTGMAVGTEQVKTNIIKTIASIPQLGDQVTQEAYQMYLQARGGNEMQLIQETQKDLLRQSLMQSFGDFDLVTDTELANLNTRNNSQYTFAYIEFPAKEMLAKLTLPSEEEIKTFYEETKEDYRLPKKVIYSYVQFETKDFASQVELSEEDLKTLYDSQIDDFKLPKKMHLRQIKIAKQVQQSNLEKMMNIPQAEENKDPKQLEEEKKELALQIKAKFNSGEAFAALARNYSEDTETKSKGGDLGWLEIKDIPEVIKSKVMDLGVGEISETINSKDAYYLVYVEEVQEASYRPYEEVKANIEQDYRQREAFPYMTFAAQEFTSKAQDAVSNGSTLQQFAASENKTVLSSVYPTDNVEDSLPALGKALKTMSLNSIEMIEDGNKVFVVKIEEEKPSAIQELNIVRASLIDKLQEKRAQDLAQIKAQELLTKVKEQNSLAAFEKVAQELALPVKHSKAFSRSEGKEEPFTAMEDSDELFNITPKQPVASTPYLSGESYYAVALVEAVPPKSEDFAKARKELLSEETSQTEQNIYQSLIANLKAHANVWIEPNLLTKNEQK